MPRPRKLALVGIVALPLAVGAFVVQEQPATASARLFDQVFAIVGDRFVDSIAVGALYEKAARGLLAELKDPYSELYTPKQLEAFNTNTGGFYGGIGMLIEDHEGSVMISKVYPNTPAEEAGIREGDRIVGVDTASTRGWKLEQVSTALKGRPGTQVKASFQRPGVPKPFEVEFTRRTIRIPAVPFALMLENKTAYIPVQQFNETTTSEFERELRRLEGEGATSVILDLRRNTGGYLEQALDMTNFFVQRGKEIASVRTRVGPPERYVAEADPIAPTIPIVVLTDGYTASASEIVAGALQDLDRALVVGTTSFGKGLVQSVYRLDGGYAIKLTTGKWYTPSGRSIQKERRLDAAGNLVEVIPDSLETEASRAGRPEFRSAGGRVVYGGGAITPDVIVPYDTLTTAEQTLARAFVPSLQDLYLVLDDYAFSFKGKVKPDFEVTKDMRSELLDRLVAKGIEVDTAQWKAGQSYVDRMLGDRIARRAFGDSTAKRREVPEDVQLQKALELLRRGHSTAELLALAPHAQPKTESRPD